MNCRDCEELLQRQLDGEPIAATPELSRHLAACPVCRWRFAAAERLQTGLSFLVSPKAPNILTARIVMNVLADRRRRAWRQYAATAMVAAACLLVAWVFFAVRPPNARLGPVIVEAPKPQPVVTAEAPLRETVKDGREALDQLANKMFAKVDEQGGVMRDAMVPFQVTGLDFASKPQTSTTQPGMAVGMQTVTAAARRGLSFLLKETPPLPVR